MVPDDYDGFDYFVRERQSDLKRIARRTRGEYQFDDVKSEAWVMAHAMYSTKNIQINFSDRDYQDRLLSYLYQALVRYTETQVRHAIRLDHGSTNDDEDVHPLMRTLVSNDGSDPLSELLAREAAQNAETIDAGSSLAAAYADLLREFDNKLQAVADFLLISVSEFRRHYAKAKWLVKHQRSIPLAHRDGFRFRLRPWRQFRFQREQVQLELPFVLDEELALEYMP